MKVAVLAKEVPDLEAQVKVAGGGGSLDIEKRRVLNFFDEIAVEAALKLKESVGAETYAPPCSTMRTAALPVMGCRCSRRSSNESRS